MSLIKKDSGNFRYRNKQKIIDTYTYDGSAYELLFLLEFLVLSLVIHLSMKLPPIIKIIEAIRLKYVFKIKFIHTSFPTEKRQLVITM